jgi:phage shock protein PspC (stress-responsive transcriptional regulator)
MRRVISVSLNGNAFQLEDDAHALLERYLDGAARALAANPDREEILADLEQAIADKCVRFLRPGRSVLQRADVATVVDEMGPVEGGAAADGETSHASSAGAAGAASDAGAAAGSAASGSSTSDAGGTSSSSGPSSNDASSGPRSTRRLYQINEGALISGLCNGIAAYFDVDVTIVRVVTVLLAFFTGGAVAVAYFVLMFIVPVANTSEERAAAHGMPFNARALIDRAREKASQFTNGTDWQKSRAEWRREWRRSRAEWRRGLANARASWRGSSFSSHADAAAGPSPLHAAAPSARPVGARLFVGVVEGVAMLLLFAFTLAWLLALGSLVVSGAVFGWGWPTEHGFWIALLALVIVWLVVSGPLKLLIRATRSYGRDYRGSTMTSGDAIVWLAVVAVAAWYGYGTVPEFREFIDLGLAWFEAAVHGTVTV